MKNVVMEISNLFKKENLEQNHDGLEEIENIPLDIVIGSEDLDNMTIDMSFKVKMYEDNIGIYIIYEDKKHYLFTQNDETEE